MLVVALSAFLALLAREWLRPVPPPQVPPAAPPALRFRGTPWVYYDGEYLRLGPSNEIIRRVVPSEEDASRRREIEAQFARGVSALVPKGGKSP